MEVKGKGEILIKLEGIELNMPPSNYSFTLRDSIHRLYPTLLMKYNDMTGQYHEYMALIEGTQIDILYSIGEDTIKCPYTIVKSSVPTQEMQSNFGGDTEIRGVHEYFYRQSLRSKSYEGPVSTIIEEITGLYPFDRKNSIIQATNSRGQFFQPMKNDADFMVNQLLPFAYTVSSKEEPYYLFINSNNELHFQTYSSMISANAPYPLTLGNAASIDSVSNNFVLGIFTKQTPLSEIRHTLNQNLFYFDSLGNQVQNDKLITDILSNAMNTIPIKADLNNITHSQSLYDDDYISEDLFINEGLVNHINRNSFGIDKVILTMNLNLSMKAGKKIDLKVLAPQKGETPELSSRNSGEYIIESTYHSWNTKTGNTVIVAFRQSTKIPSDYRNKRITVTG